MNDESSPLTTSPLTTSGGKHASAIPPGGLPLGFDELRIKWAAELAHVREVTLLGTADLAFWREWLKPEGLMPVESGGRAQLMLVAVEGRFMGLRFRELSFSVLVSPDGDEGAKESPPPGGAFLVRAFNSNWFFAFCERTLFGTPYDYGDVRLMTSLPASIQLAAGGQPAFLAEMAASSNADAREARCVGEDGWFGPVYLPARRRGTSQFFVARIRGRTAIYPFLAEHDKLTIRPTPGWPVLQALLGSGFAATEWIVREDAEHAKSKTYRR